MGILVNLKRKKRQWLREESSLMGRDETLPAGGTRSLRYFNQREEPGDRATSTCREKHNLDQRESTGDQTQLPPGDKKIIVSGRDRSLVRGAAGVCGIPCMGYTSAQRGAITCWGTESSCGSGIREAVVLDFRLPGDGYYNMREECRGHPGEDRNIMFCGAARDAQLPCPAGGSDLILVI